MSTEEISKEMQDVNISKYPFTLQELTSAFKKTIIKYHPDLNKDVNTEEVHNKTIEIINSYNYLKNFAIDKQVKQPDINPGLFDFKKECDWCKGKGYEIKMVRVKGYDCTRCKDTGFIEVKCNKCDEGVFTLRSGRKVSCKACKGTGIYKLKCHHRIDYTRSFWDEFFGFNKHEYKEKPVTCNRCNGAGKVDYEPINPVIPKGAILNSKVGG